MSVAPDVAERVAKMLRLACCETAPDGERMAAIGRLSAIAAANDLDWDRALSGSGPTRDQMQELFDAGYERGLADGRAETQRYWTPTSGTSAEIGDDARRLGTILEATAKANGLLTDWETTFAADMRERFERFGNRMYVSEKQWAVLDRLETKMRRAGTL